jgi:hypothetical protein
VCGLDYEEDVEMSDSPIDYHGLCNRLAEVFNAEDDTPDELSTEAREAIEHLWRERDRLRAALERYGRHEGGCHVVSSAYGDWEKPDTCTCGLREALKP